MHYSVAAAVFVWVAARNVLAPSLMRTLTRLADVLHGLFIRAVMFILHRSSGHLTLGGVLAVSVPTPKTQTVCTGFT